VIPRSRSAMDPVTADLINDLDLTLLADRRRSSPMIKTYFYEAMVRCFVCGGYYVRVPWLRPRTALTIRSTA